MWERVGELGGREGRGFAAAAVMDEAALRYRGHFRVLVGEVEGAAGDLDGEGLIAIEGEEPDAGVVIDVEGGGGGLDGDKPTGRMRSMKKGTIPR